MICLNLHVIFLYLLGVWFRFFVIGTKSTNQMKWRYFISYWQKTNGLSTLSPLVVLLIPGTYSYQVICIERIKFFIIELKFVSFNESESLILTFWKREETFPVCSVFVDLEKNHYCTFCLLRCVLQCIGCHIFMQSSCWWGGTGA